MKKTFFAAISIACCWLEVNAQEVNKDRPLPEVKPKRQECHMLVEDSSTIALPPWFGNNKFLTGYTEKKEREKKEKQKHSEEYSESGRTMLLTCSSSYNTLVPLRIIVWKSGTNNQYIDESKIALIIGDAN